MPLSQLRRHSTRAVGTATGSTVRAVNFGVPGNAPNHLVRAFEAGLAAACPDIPRSIVHCEHFRPGRPVPTHRMTAAV